LEWLQGGIEQSWEHVRTCKQRVGGHALW
jgi:hypothetical protein